METAQLIAVASLVLLAGCGQSDAREMKDRETAPPGDFRFVGRSSPCFLEPAEQPRAIRVNCFHIDGILHIHSNRFAKLPRWRGESWVNTVRRNPLVRVEIAGNVYPMLATAIDDEQRREAILKERGYWYAWDGITVFSFTVR